MMDLLLVFVASLLGIGTGIFTVLSLIEKPVWPLMWAPRSTLIGDDEARAVHAILKRLIHLLPPTMMVTMGSVSLLLVFFTFISGFSAASLVMASIFFLQLVLIVSRLSHDIRGVDEVASEGETDHVRDGLGALALLHHRGLLMTVSTLLAVWLVAAGLA